MYRVCYIARPGIAAVPLARRHCHTRHGVTVELVARWRADFFFFFF
jgi:hypothetical protein